MTASFSRFSRLISSVRGSDLPAGLQVPLPASRNAVHMHQRGQEPFGLDVDSRFRDDHGGEKLPQFIRKTTVFDAQEIIS
jgi:hypothetical protein